MEYRDIRNVVDAAIRASTSDLENRLAEPASNYSDRARAVMFAELDRRTSAKPGPNDAFLTAELIALASQIDVPVVPLSVSLAALSTYIEAVCTHDRVFVRKRKFSSQRATTIEHCTTGSDVQRDIAALWNAPGQLGIDSLVGGSLSSFVEDTADAATAEGLDGGQVEFPGAFSPSSHMGDQGRVLLDAGGLEALKYIYFLSGMSESIRLSSFSDLDAAAQALARHDSPPHEFSTTDSRAAWFVHDHIYETQHRIPHYPDIVTHSYAAPFLRAIEPLHHLPTERFKQLCSEWKISADELLRATGSREQALPPLLTIVLDRARSIQDIPAQIGRLRNECEEIREIGRRYIRYLEFSQNARERADVVREFDQSWNLASKRIRKGGKRAQEISFSTKDAVEAGLDVLVKQDVTKAAAVAGAVWDQLVDHRTYPIVRAYTSVAATMDEFSEGHTKIETLFGRPLDKDGIQKLDAIRSGLDAVSRYSRFPPDRRL